MEQALEMRWPRLRPPEELREFYAIVLRPKNNEGQKDLATGISKRGTMCLDAQSIVSKSWTLTTSGHAQTSSSASFFSGQAPTASSSTSISDIKIPDALATRPLNKAAPGQLTTAISLSLHHQDDHPSVSRSNLISVAGNPSLVFHSDQNEGEASRTRDGTEEELYNLRSLRLVSM